MNAGAIGMGGVGSGCSPERGTVRGAFKLRLANLVEGARQVPASDGVVRYSATIGRPGDRLCRTTRAILADVSLGPDGGTVRLRYEAQPRAPVGAIAEPVPIDETIAVVVQPQPFGGAPQRFMVCPFTGRRAKALYLPWGATRFGSREAYRLVYQSQRRGPADRALAVARKIRNGLGGSPSVLDSFPERPHGMHWKRYDRLRAQDAAATQVSMRMIEAKLDRLSPGWRKAEVGGA